MAATDRFKDQYLDPLRAGRPEWPYLHAPLVTPDDSNDLAYVTRALWIGAGGNVVVIMQDGNEATFENVPPGYELRIRVPRVKATGTTATPILALD